MLRQVTTKNGKVKGLPGNDPRITAFKGIPFAAPPVGKLRWKAPQSAAPWDGVLNAYEFGPISIQDTPGLGDDLYCREWHVDCEIPMSEDCLYLNVWTGAKSCDEKLPVLVWYFGGAFQWGYTSEMEFNGERLARQGIIVVSVGYRLGALGYLAHPDLTREDPEHPTNFGLLDQQAGLKWVYDNIEAFGGDPEKITIGGQSAGGGSVLSLLSNPVNKKYVKGASMFSGIIRSPFFIDPIIQPKPFEQAEAIGKDFIDFLGVGSVEEARELDAIAIRDAYAKFAVDHPRFTPCIDGISITDDPYKLMLEGKTLDVPVITGYTKDEFFFPIPADSEVSGGNAIALLDPDTQVIPSENGSLYNMVENSVNTVCHNHQKLMADNKMTSDMYIYSFEPSVPGDDNPGVFHSCDLWFFFGNVPMCHRAYTGKHYELSLTMSHYWTNFIKTGDPNGIGFDDKPLPKWSPVSAGNDKMIFTE